MSNLWKLKEWLTLDEAADVLTKNLGENIKELDILRWAIAGKITLALNFWTSFWARKYVVKKTTESDLLEPFETMNARRYFSSPSEKVLGGMLMFWPSRECVLIDISQIFWSLPEASRRQALEVLSQSPFPKAAEVIEFLNSRLHERAEFLDKPLTKQLPFHWISSHEHLSPVGDEVTFCAPGIYQFTEYGGINKLLKKTSMEYLGNSEQASNIVLGFFDGIFLADSDATYLKLLDRLPMDKCRIDSPRHPDNFYPTDFNHEPTICVLPNDLVTFIASISHSPEFNGKQRTSVRSMADLKIQEIVEAAEGLGFDLLSIPARGKGKIMAVCFANKRTIASEHAFRTAWKNATKANKIKSAVPGV